MDIISMILARNQGGNGSGFGLPVVEIADITAITTEENAKLTACMGMPIILVAQGNAILCSSTIMDADYPCFSNADLQVTLGTVDGVSWVLV